MSLFLSHIRLSCSPSAQALAGLLMPEDQAQRYSAQHNLLWSVFADGPERKRDFLWREGADGIIDHPGNWKSKTLTPFLPVSQRALAAPRHSVAA